LISEPSFFNTTQSTRAAFPAASDRYTSFATSSFGARGGLRDQGMRVVGKSGRLLPAPSIVADIAMKLLA
jgi:hypothetical protein